MRFKIHATSIALIAAAFLTIGCTPTATEIQKDGQALNSTLTQLAAVEQPLNPTLAANLLTAANALEAVTANWQTGNPVAVFNDAANAVDVALAAIPQTAAVAPFIPIIVGGIDLLIANIPGATSTTSVAIAYNPVQVSLARYRAEGATAVKPTRFGTPRSAFIAAWNKQLAAHPTAGLSPIH
jgi:hypothetical protein